MITFTDFRACLFFGFCTSMWQISLLTIVDVSSFVSVYSLSPCKSRFISTDFCFISDSCFSSSLTFSSNYFLKKQKNAHRLRRAKIPTGYIPVSKKICDCSLLACENHSSSFCGHYFFIKEKCLPNQMASLRTLLCFFQCNGKILIHIINHLHTWINVSQFD